MDKRDAIPISKSRLAHFEPLARLSPTRLEELAAICYIEPVSKNLDPTRMMNYGMQAVVAVDLGIRYDNGNKIFTGRHRRCQTPSRCRAFKN
jgi:hypothetical protein